MDKKKSSESCDDLKEMYVFYKRKQESCCGAMVILVSRQVLILQNINASPILILFHYLASGKLLPKVSMKWRILAMFAR